MITTASVSHSLRTLCVHNPSPVFILDLYIVDISPSVCDTAENSVLIEAGTQGGSTFHHHGGKCMILLVSISLLRVSAVHLKNH